MTLHEMLIADLKMMVIFVLVFSVIIFFWWYFIIRKTSKTCTDCKYNHCITKEGCDDDDVIVRCVYPLPRHLESHSNDIVAGRMGNFVCGDIPKPGSCKTYVWNGKYRELWKRRRI